MNHQSKDKKEGNVGQGATAPLAAAALEQTQIAKYHTKGGTGFAAEDANNLADRLRGKDATVVGQSNALHGADRLVDGVRVQSKYYRTPADTVRSAFDPNGAYRYGGQVLEVPKEQYDQCVALMRERIGRGQVPGHTDPADAELLVKKGTVTYKQARNIARAGNIDSVRFDVQTGAAVSSGVFGLSFAINYWQGRRHGLSGSDAIRAAFREALCVGAATLVTHVVGAQLLRTRAAAWGTVAVRPGVRAAARTALGKEVVEGIATASLGKAVHGAAAVNHVSKLLRSNAVTGGVMAAVACAPDFYRAAFDESISWKQFTKNSMVNVAGVAGGVAGWMGGAAAGAAIGSVVPVVGTAVGGVVGGLLGSLGGGAAAGKLTQSVADGMVEDDASALLKVLEKELQKLSQEYMLDKPEIKQVLAEVRATADADWLRRMYKKTGGRKGPGRRFVRQAFERTFKEVATRRRTLVSPSAEHFRREVQELGRESASTSSSTERGDGLYADRETGELRVNAEDGGEDMDRLPATRMAREGFFVGEASRRPAATLPIARTPDLSGTVRDMAARVGRQTELPTARPQGGMMNNRNQTNQTDAADPNRVERAFESIAEGRDDMGLYFDVETGELRASGEDGREDADGLPATRMAREGFFVGSGLPSMARSKRLEIEKQTLSAKMPWLRFRFQYLADARRSGVVCEMATNSGNSYTLWIRLRKAFPNKPPKMYVVQPKSLRDRRGRNLSSIGASHAMHLLEADENGHLQICHCDDAHWTPNMTLFKVVEKGRLWLEAYELHKAKGKDIDHYLRHM